MAQGILEASGKGALSGAGSGLMLGSNPALLGATGGLSAPIGAAAGALLGGTFAGIKQNQANKSQQIPLIDPAEMKRRAELEQTRKSLAVGTDPATQLGIQSAQTIARGAQNPIVRSTGGDVSSTTDALLKTQRNAQAGANQAIAEGQQRIPYFDSAYGNLLSGIAQRKLELSLLNRSQRTAENAQSRTDQNLNANAILGTQGGTQNMEEAFSNLGRFFRTRAADQQGIVVNDPNTYQWSQPIGTLTTAPPQGIEVIGLDPNIYGAGQNLTGILSGSLSGF